MKTTAQIFAILFISLLVVGATYGVSQTSWAAHQGFGRRPPRGEERVAIAASAQQGGDAQLVQGEPDREEGFRREPRADGFSLFGLLSFLPTLLPMAVVIGGVSLFNRWRGHTRSRRKNGSTLVR